MPVPLPVAAAVQIAQGVVLSAVAILLGLRMARHCENAEKLAAYLGNHDKISWVNYAALPDSPYYPTCQRITGGKASGILSFGIKGGIEAGGTNFVCAIGTGPDDIREMGGEERDMGFLELPSPLEQLPVGYRAVSYILDLTDGRRGRPGRH